MEKQTRVVVYGSSLSMAGIAASLKAEAGLEVVCVDADWLPGSDPSCEVIAHVLPASGQEHPGMRPDVILFDLQAIQPVLHRVLELGLQGLRLIGMDTGSNGILVLSAYPAQALSAAELIDIILQEDSNAEGRKGEGNDLQQESPEKEEA